MRIPFEPRNESEEQLMARVLLAQMLKAMLDGRRTETLNTALQQIVGRTIFNDVDYFGSTGCMVTFNEDERELVLTVYKDLGKTAETGVWYRHFGIEFCDAHGFHLSEILPPFLVADLPKDAQIETSQVSSHQRKSNLN